MFDIEINSKIDDDKSSKGVWKNISLGFKLRVKRIDTPEYRIALLRIQKGNEFTADSLDDVQQLAVGEGMVSKVLAAHVIVDWSGVSINGKEIPYDVDMMEKLLISSSKLGNVVYALGSEDSNYRPDEISEK